MKIIEIELPEDIERQLGSTGINKHDFILEAIREKIKQQEDLIMKLKEGYKSTYKEDQDIADEFAFI